MSGPNGDLSRARFKRDIIEFFQISWAMIVRQPEHRRPYLSLLSYCIRHNPHALNAALIMYALFVHLGPFSRYVVGEIDAQIAAVESGEWQRPVLEAAQ